MDSHRLPQGMYTDGSPEDDVIQKMTRYDFIMFHAWVLCMNAADVTTIKIIMIIMPSHPKLQAFPHVSFSWHSIIAYVTTSISTQHHHLFLSFYFEWGAITSILSN